MHIKVGLVSALALASSASAFTLQGEQGLRGEGMTQTNEYAIRNMDEICVSTRPVPMCEQDYVVKSFKNTKVGFHCVSRNSSEGQRLKQQVENDQVIPEMSGKTVHVQGRVQVPTRCVAKSQVSGQEQRRRKQQQQHGQRVELIENEYSSIYDQENSWDAEEDSLDTVEQYNQYNKRRYQEDNEWQKMQSLFLQYPELTHKNLHQLVKTNEGTYQQVADQLRELVQQKQLTSNLMPQVQNTLPTFFTQTAKQLYDAMQEQKDQKQQNKHHRTMAIEQLQDQEYHLDQLVGDYQQYKQVMKRVYVYIVKEALKLNQQAPRRLQHIPELVRKVWEKTQRQELTKKQIQKVDEVLEQVQQLLDLDQTNQLLADELVTEQLKTSQRQARRNLMKIIVTGLMMEANPSFQQHY